VHQEGATDRGGSCAHQPRPVELGIPDGEADGLTAERLIRQRALRAAILIDAVRCVMGVPGTHEPGTRRAAMRWVLSRDGGAPFSFHNVCESLGFDPNRIREVLMTPFAGSDRPLRIAVRRKRWSASPRAWVRRPRRDRARARAQAGVRPS
jgi:hypothetical protein